MLGTMLSTLFKCLHLHDLPGRAMSSTDKRKEPGKVRCLCPNHRASGGRSEGESGLPPQPTLLLLHHVPSSPCVKMKFVSIDIIYRSHLLLLLETHKMSLVSLPSKSPS